MTTDEIINHPIINKTILAGYMGITKQTLYKKINGKEGQRITDNDRDKVRVIIKKLFT